jgi:ribosomal-protein-alanine N-acetyltransferase
VLNNDETLPPIFTPRLVLHHLSPSRLVMLFEEPENDVIYRGCDYTNPHRDLVDNPGPLKWRVPQVTKDASLNKWFLRWIVLASTKEIIGSISFHGAPNDNGMIEIGLGVQPDFQRHGYAKEALVGMWSWVIEQPGVEVLRYTVSATNLASMKIIHGFDFTHVGVQIDKEDGPEEIFEMSAAEFQRRHAAPWRAPSL